jgi:hypothetical protein
MSIYSHSLLALVLCTSLGCSHQMAVSNTGFVWQSTLMDLRIGYKLGVADNVQLEQGKEAMSTQAAEMLEEILPEIVEAAVRAALVGAGVGAAGSLIEACPVPLRDLLGGGDAEAVVDPEATEPEAAEKPGRRRTPEEKAANRAERGA